MPAPLSSARRHSPVLAGILLGVLILVAALVYANSGREDSSTAPPSTQRGEVSVSLIEMRITPATITVAPGQRLMLRVTNNGMMSHDLRLSNGVRTPMLAPGESVSLDAGVITAPLDGWCTVPGHRAAGMRMQIVTD